MLLTNSPIEDANYEIGIAVGHMRTRTLKIKDSTVRREIADTTDKLDAIFSNLPAKPWPMKGYGHPSVESRLDWKASREAFQVS
jgi:hypothetical protein